jgi:hypothetical protein
LTVHSGIRESLKLGGMNSSKFCGSTIEHLQPFGLAPDDLLLADAKPGPADLALEVQLAQPA